MRFTGRNGVRRRRGHDGGTMVYLGYEWHSVAGALFLVAVIDWWLICFR